MFIVFYTILADFEMFVLHCDIYSNRFFWFIIKLSFFLRRMLQRRNLFLTPKLVMARLMIITHLKAVMGPAQIKMVKMILYLFNPVLMMMNPPTPPL